MSGVRADACSLVTGVKPPRLRGGGAPKVSVRAQRSCLSGQPITPDTTPGIAPGITPGITVRPGVMRDKSFRIDV